MNTFGVFEIWGWILAAIGLSVVNKLSKGAAWTIVILIVLIGLGVPACWERFLRERRR